MTGKRITGPLGEIAKAIAGRTVADASLNDSEIAVRFEDGDWLYGAFWSMGEDDVEADYDGELNLATLHEIGVITRDEMNEMHRTRKEAEASRREREARQQYERLRAKFEPGAGDTPRSSAV